MIKKLRTEIAKGNIDGAINQLLAIKDDKIHNEAIQISAQYESYRKRERLALSSAEELNIENNRIVNALLAIVAHLPDQEKKSLPIAVDKNNINWKIIIPGILGLGILAGVFFLWPSNKTFSISVLVKENNKTVNNSAYGKIKIDKDLFSKTKGINQAGQAVFNDIPSNYLQKDFQLSFIPTDSLLFEHSYLLLSFKEEVIYTIDINKKNIETSTPAATNNTATKAVEKKVNTLPKERPRLNKGQRQ